MGKTLREKAVWAVVGVIALYAVAVGVWFLCAEAAWKKAARNYEKAKDTYREASCRDRERPDRQGDRGG